MRISDWSSDVCSSDLADKRGQTVQPRLDTAERCFPGGLIHDVFPIPSEDGWRTIGMRAPSVNGATRALRRLTLTTRSEEHTSELQSLVRISYAVFCLKKKKTQNRT